MPQTNSISFDEVLGLLRGPVVQEFEAQVSWLKFRRIPHHKKYAKELREMFSRL